jgi:thiamine pyrophosphokinase
MQPYTVIVSGGRLGDPDFFRTQIESLAGRLLVGCDGGVRHLRRAGFRPDVLLGDMDSLPAAWAAEYEQAGVKILRYPPDKDFTDTALALDYAIGQRSRRIDLWGALGGRIDHALANISLLIRGREARIFTRIVDEFAELFVADAETVIEDAAGCLVSLLALSPQAAGVTLEGFQYPLDQEALFAAESRGISNCITASRAVIRVAAGHLLVIRYWHRDVFPEEA